ncbi:MAG: alpha/beta fold hydrolase [Streptosporangiales bacterium]|nr:alpha/beta fold hydrolase [Streptosporangiales bacterium]
MKPWRALRGRPRAVAAAVAVGVLLGAGGAWGLNSASAPPPVDAQPQRIPVTDGPRDDEKVTIDATFFPSVTGSPAPAVLLAHGFGGSKDDLKAEAERLARDGYAVLTYSARGFGASTGKVALNSPDYEVKDVKALLDWLAKRPEVRQDAAGDPRVGIAGASYGGAIALLAAGHDQRVDAIAPQLTWHDLADSLFPENSGQGAEEGVFKKTWAGLFFTVGAAGMGDLMTAAGAGAGTGEDEDEGGGDSESSEETQTEEGGQAGGQSSGVAGGLGSGGPAAAGVGGAGGAAASFGDLDAIACGRFRPEICDTYRESATQGKATPETLRLLRESSPATVTAKIKAPTLLVQGQSDSLFGLDQADANARDIARNGTPVRMAWIEGGHDGGDREVERVRGLVSGWFDRYLRGEPFAEGTDATAGFTVTRQGGVDSTNGETVTSHAAAPAYPGAGDRTAAENVTLGMGGPAMPVISPPGGSPTSISAVPGLGGIGALGGLAGGLTLDMPGQTAMFETEALDRTVHVTGASTVRLRVTGPGEAIMFAKLYDVSPDGRQATLPHQLASPVRVPDATRGETITVTLPTIDHEFDRGHRLRLVLTATDLAYATPAKSAAHLVTMAEEGPGSAITVPTVPGLRSEVSTVPWWVWAGPLAGLVIAALLILTGRRKVRPGRPDRRLTEVPLRITGLTKSYAGGTKAVDDLSFEVQQGQVLGLLGPNGAGKTTALRMLMGLIHPDAGEVRIFGHKVTEGAPVLSRLGSFVEGPGFLPHLSGRANLELYWSATGRPVEDAHLEEALEIAGLGTAIDRAVRTYSQGMRQRLAIAQAMLGLPDLLVLDEPTNGLDPPQIHAMRRVLADYARAGRTVIVSSHLLAEVEQTCTHVVVMNRGGRIAAGPVHEIVGGGSTLLIGTADTERALKVLRALSGVEAAEPAEQGVLVRLDGAEPSLVVAELVGAGVPVDRVTPNRRLEDAFLALIGEER